MLSETSGVQDRQLPKKGLVALLVSAGAFSMVPSGISFGKRITHGSAGAGYTFGSTTFVAQASLTINAWHNIVFKGSHRSKRCTISLLVLGVLTMVPAWISGYSAAAKASPDDLAWNLISTLVPCLLTAGIYTDVVGEFIDNVRAIRASQNTLGERPVTKLQLGLSAGAAFTSSAGSFLLSYYFFDHALKNKVSPVLDHLVSMLISLPSVICRGMLASRSLIRVSSRVLDYYEKDPIERACHFNLLSILACLFGAAGAGAFTEIVLEGCEKGGFDFGIKILWSALAFTVVSILNSDATTRLLYNAKKSLENIECWAFFGATERIEGVRQILINPESTK